MTVPENRAHWIGPVPPGRPMNPVVIVTSPLIASQLALLAETEAFTEAYEEHPKAYAGVKDLLEKLTAELERAGRVEWVGDRVAKHAAEEGMHADREPPVISAKEAGSLVRQGIDDLFEVQFKPGRASVPVIIPEIS
jgi:hypothetical protein